MLRDRNPLHQPNLVSKRQLDLPPGMHFLKKKKKKKKNRTES